MQITTAPTYWARIHMAGCYADAQRICRDYCFHVGMCVTLTATEYIYSGGQESGFVVGLINYPRFPATPEEIDAKAEVLARLLADGLSQRSYTIETPAVTRWHTRPLPFEVEPIAGLPSEPPIPNKKTSAPESTAPEPALSMTEEPKG